MALISGDVDCQPVWPMKTDILNITQAYKVYFSLEFYVSSALVKNNVFWFCMVVRNFGTVRCRIHFWWMWCKSYQNRSRFAKFVATSLLPFLMDHSVHRVIVNFVHAVVVWWYLIRLLSSSLLYTVLTASKTLSWSCLEYCPDLVSWGQDGSRHLKTVTSWALKHFAEYYIANISRKPE